MSICVTGPGCLDAWVEADEEDKEVFCDAVWERREVGVGGGRGVAASGLALAFLRRGRGRVWGVWDC